jgi:hypothetical protein
MCELRLFVIVEVERDPTLPIEPACRGEPSARARLREHVSQLIHRMVNVVLHVKGLFFAVFQDGEGRQLAKLSHSTIDGPSLHPVRWYSVEETLTDHLVELTWVEITHCMNLQLSSNSPFLLDFSREVDAFSRSPRLTAIRWPP